MNAQAYHFDTCNRVDNIIGTQGFSIFHHKSGQNNAVLHYHQSCELLLSISGSNTVLLGERFYLMESGSLFTIPYGSSHKLLIASQSAECFSFHASVEWLRQNSTINTNLASCFEEVKSIKLDFFYLQQLKSILAEIESSDSLYGGDVLKLSSAIRFAALCSRLFADKQAQTEIQPLHCTNDLVGDIIETIDQSFCSDISLKSLAGDKFISVNHLCRIFKTHTGTTVKQYITARRILFAKNTLCNGASVKEACALAGFADYAHFIRTFTQIVGVSPKQYASSMLIKNDDKIEMTYECI